MPLTFAGTDEKRTIKKVGGKDNTKRFLGSLGFVEGAEVTVLSGINVKSDCQYQRVPYCRQ
jgi:ferrous iron transport protein A